MDRLLPILSGSLREVLETIVKKEDDPIAKELLEVDSIVNDFNNIIFNITVDFYNAVMENVINAKITDEVRMLSVRVNEFEVSFLPKDKLPEYGPHGTWTRKNRQTGKPARIFQKLLKKEFKPREWEIFTNVFKAEMCQCVDFELVEGEDIRKWYNCNNYYKCEGTLGNSCMRYNECSSFFDIYVDNAKMLISKKNDLLTGRAIVWEIGDIVLLDRIYTCFDYLENCFIDYAKSNKWWIRNDNSLLSTGDEQYWLTPDDDYGYANDREFTIKIPCKYDKVPYMDSFRYYNGNELSTHPNGGFSLDSTDGEYRGESYICEHCGAEFYGYDGDTPEGLHWSEWGDAYYCDNCCWYSDGLDDYIPNSEDAITVITRWGSDTYPASYVDEHFVDTPDGSEDSDDIVMIDDSYYFVTNKIIFNVDENRYELRKNTVSNLKPTQSELPEDDAFFITIDDNYFDTANNVSSNCATDTLEELQNTINRL